MAYFDDDKAFLAARIERLRSPLAQCALCAWFNEWHRFSERDQLAISYVMLAMGLTPSLNATDARGGIHVWPRREHWRAPKPPAGPKPWRYVTYVGHGGPG